MAFPLQWMDLAALDPARGLEIVTFSHEPAVGFGDKKNSGLLRLRMSGYDKSPRDEWPPKALEAGRSGNK